jgi:hypothetical protein
MRDRRLAPCGSVLFHPVVCGPEGCLFSGGGPFDPRKGDTLAESVLSLKLTTDRLADQRLAPCRSGYWLVVIPDGGVRVPS